MPIEFRRSPGRPGRNDPPAPAVRIRTEIPEAMLAELVSLAEAKKLSRQAAIREALAMWIEAHRAGK